jgi:hypothetical protein
MDFFYVPSAGCPFMQFVQRWSSVQIAQVHPVIQSSETGVQSREFKNQMKRHLRML